MPANSGPSTGRNVFGIVTAILLSTPFILDISFDVKLALRYFEEGRIVWGSLTASFILLNWVAQIIVAFCIPLGLRQIAPRFEKIAPIFAFFGVLPIAVKIFSKIGHFSERESQKLRQAHQSVLLVELFCEALPQFFLQVYIVGTGSSNNFVLQMISIATSLSSISLGLTNGVALYGFLGEGIYPRFTTTFWREIGFQCLVVPHCLFACLGKLWPAIRGIAYFVKCFSYTDDGEGMFSLLVLSVLGIVLFFYDLACPFLCRPLGRRVGRWALLLFCFGGLIIIRDFAMTHLGHTMATHDANDTHSSHDSNDIHDTHGFFLWFAIVYVVVLISGFVYGFVLTIFWPVMEVFFFPLSDDNPVEEEQNEGFSLSNNYPVDEEQNRGFPLSKNFLVKEDQNEGFPLSNNYTVEEEQNEGFPLSNNNPVEEEQNQGCSLSNNKLAEEEQNQSFPLRNNYRVKEEQNKGFPLSNNYPVEEEQNQCFPLSNNIPVEEAQNEGYPLSDNDPVEEEQSKGFPLSNNNPVEEIQNKGFSLSNKNPVEKEQNDGFPLSNNNLVEEEQDQGFPLNDNNPVEEEQNKGFGYLFRMIFGKIRPNWSPSPNARSLKECILKGL